MTSDWLNLTSWRKKNQSSISKTVAAKCLNRLDIRKETWRRSLSLTGYPMDNYIFKVKNKETRKISFSISLVTLLLTLDKYFPTLVEYASCQMIIKTTQWKHHWLYSCFFHIYLEEFHKSIYHLANWHSSIIKIIEVLTQALLANLHLPPHLVL